MIPDLGKYAAEVSAAYAVSILLVVGLVLVSVWQSRRIKAQLAAAEERAR